MVNNRIPDDERLPFFDKVSGATFKHATYYLSVRHVSVGKFFFIFHGPIVSNMSIIDRTGEKSSK